MIDKATTLIQYLAGKVSAVCLFSGCTAFDFIQKQRKRRTLSRKRLDTARNA
jgi:hypothetical protein